jgi:high affinity sulfate transporter 1
MLRSSLSFDFGVWKDRFRRVKSPNMNFIPPRGDVFAGLSVAGLLLPEAVAYASIAGLPPQHALFAGLAGLILYAIFGGSRFAIVSPTSSSAAIVAAAAASASTSLSPKEYKLAVAAAVLLTGAFFVIGGIARFGSLSNFISRPVLKGFAFGIAVTIVAKQIVTICGLHGISGNPFQIAAGLVPRVGEFKPMSVVIGVVALLALVLLKRLPRLPGAFLVLAAGIALSYAVDLEKRGVALAGNIDVVPIAPSIPQLTWHEWSRLGQVALPLFLIVFAESWGAMRTLALRHGDRLDANRELVALGVSNIASGLVRGMPVGAGFSASSANESAGAMSRIAGVCAAIVMVIAIAVAGGQIARVPEPVVGAVVISALLHSLDPGPLLRLWRLNKDQYVATVAAVGVMILGVVDGMLVAVALSIAATLQRMANPTIATLGELAGSHNFVDVSYMTEARTDPHIHILRPSQPLFFANAETTLARVAALAISDSVRVAILSLEDSDSVDSTALDALLECDQTLDRAGCTLILARVKQDVLEALGRSGPAGASLRLRSYFSVADAFDGARQVVRRIETAGNGSDRLKKEKSKQ